MPLTRASITSVESHAVEIINVGTLANIFASNAKFSSSLVISKGWLFFHVSILQ